MCTKITTINTIVDIHGIIVTSLIRMLQHFNTSSIFQNISSIFAVFNSKFPMSTCSCRDHEMVWLYKVTHEHPDLGKCNEIEV